MPTLRIKNEHYEILQKDAMYDKWLVNVMTSWDAVDCRINPNNLDTRDTLDANFDMCELLIHAFYWETSIEGFDFWSNYHNKFDNE